MKLRTLFFAMIMSVPIWSQSSYQDGIIQKVNNPTITPVKYPYVREGDIMWAKRIWRVVDFREKINQYLMFPLTENNNRINLVAVLRQGIQEGALQPFDPFNGDDFRVKMSTEEALMIGVTYDTVPLINPNPPYEYLRDTVYATNFDPFKVKKLKIKEDWFFDSKRSVMEVRIVGICPVYEVYDGNSGELIGLRDMFWIHFEEARPYLATYKIYNPYNFGQRISYDDAFMKRIFNSLIYKQDNAMDRRIAEYQEGLDALYEAEDIKNDIFIFEHDLWEQ